MLPERSDMRRRRRGQGGWEIGTGLVFGGHGRRLTRNACVIFRNMKCDALQRPATYMDDVCAIIGFSATVRLIAWHGGSHIYVPGEATPGHPLVALMGESALRALVDEFGSQTLWIPADVNGGAREAIQRKRTVARLIHRGHSSHQIAAETGLALRTVQRISRELRDANLVPTTEPDRVAGAHFL